MSDIECFQEKYLEDAAKLCIENYTNLRNMIPLLPERYEQSEVVFPLLQDIIKEHPGVVCLEQGTLSGYMTGFQRIPYFKGIQQGVYIPEWGHAAVPGTQRARLYHEMYARLSHEWVGEGCFTHAITYYATDPEIQELFSWNGFGLQVIDAIRSLDPIPCEPVAHILIRPASPDDLDALVTLKNGLRSHLAGSPIFLYQERGEHDYEELTADLDNHEKRIVVAEYQGKIVAGIIGNMNLMPGCQIVTGPKTAAINFGYTAPHVRKHGIATLLLNDVLTWAASNNLKRCSVDFESHNKEGREFWLKYFSPVCFSSIRYIDERIAWR